MAQVQSRRVIEDGISHPLPRNWRLSAFSVGRGSFNSCSICCLKHVHEHAGATNQSICSPKVLSRRCRHDCEMKEHEENVKDVV